MPGTQYTGKAGHLAVMGEFCLRGYNAAMPEIDKGDDVFVVKDDTGVMWRLQVKTSLGRAQKLSRRYQFRIKHQAITQAQTPELHFAFVMRRDRTWYFLLMDRAVLKNYVRNGVGTRADSHTQLTVIFGKDNSVTCSGIDWSHHLEDWSTWRKVP